MADLDVSSCSIDQVLARLYAGKYRVPVFQRAFKWSPQAAADLATSILKGRPIGMATLWDIGEEASSPVATRPVQLKNVKAQPPASFLAEDSSESGWKAILDGQQRCTAIAMCFGGLRTENKSLRTTGRFFLDLDSSQEDAWVRYLRQGEIERLGLTAFSEALARGFLPLDVEPDPATGTWNFLDAWQSHRDTVAKPEIYPPDALPDEELIKSRQARILTALKGLQEVELATYTIGSSYSLSDICEIFETLNTTGLRVGIVDLIHSNLFNATHSNDEPFYLREWIDNLGEQLGAKGWADSEAYPERIVQMVTASYIGMTNRPPATNAAGEALNITSIKAGDLLATPSAFWLQVRDKQDKFATVLGDFQQTVADAYFPMKWCPYPASASVYTGIAWSKAEESLDEDEGWGAPELKRLFRAFFWRNAMSGRYDQGFLTKVASDIDGLREILRLRGNCSSMGDWINTAAEALTTLMGDSMPSREEVLDWVLNDTVYGARRLAIRLPVLTQCKFDLLSTEDISWPTREDTEVHHIFPKNWLTNNKAGALANAFEEAEENDWDIVNCTANQVPLSRESNTEWMAKKPAAALEDHDVTYDAYKGILASAFIDENCFGILLNGDLEAVRDFESARAELVTSWLMDAMELTAG